MFFRGLAASNILKIEFASKELEDRDDMFNWPKQIATAEAPKAKTDKKQKGKESHDSSAKAKRAADAKEKLETFTPLNTLREQIMVALQRESRLPERQALSVSSVKKSNPNKTYAYHINFGHLTEDCIFLKKGNPKDD